MKHLAFFCLLALGFCASKLCAQNLVISTQNPDDLYVCGSDQISVTLQNTGSAAATALQAKVTLPNGIVYETGSVGGGAAEFNVTNLSAPIFSLTDLAAGASISFTLSVQASCALIADINAGFQFSNKIDATYAGGSKDFTGSLYAVETGLLLINSVVPITQSGENGQILQRTITVKNTRQGPIESLVFTDQHFPGLSMSLNGSTAQVNTATLFSAEVPGGYFAGFGDGDNLLEFNEIVTLTENIVVEDCGIPSFTNPSLLRVGWGCGGTVCRYDSAAASVTILPSAENPNLVFFSQYAPPLSQCGSIPATQEILIVNVGAAAANNVSVLVGTDSLGQLGLDANSFAWNSGSGWLPLTPSGGTPTLLATCDLSGFYELIPITVPTVPPGDTVRLRFDAYYCNAPCSNVLPNIFFNFSYQKNCPSTSVVTGSDVFEIVLEELKIESSTFFNIGDCLIDDSTYQFNYWVKSERLLTHPGYVQAIFDLPFGLEWVEDCDLTLSGTAPIQQTISPAAGGGSQVRLVFDAPFSSDSVGGFFCLRYHCEQNLPCEAGIPSVPPRGADYVVYPPGEGCSGCELKVKSTTLLSMSADESALCGLSVCDEFVLVVDNQCDTTGGGGGGGGGGGVGIPPTAAANFDTYRTNVGLQDNNNDRSADSNAPANSPQIRRDRFLPGDTLRHELKVAMLTGSLSELNFRLFDESWASDFGIDGGDPYEISAGKLLFANYDTLEFVAARLIIRTAAGAEYECPVANPNIKSDQHYIQVAQPNIRPAQVYDEMSTMFHQFELNLPTLAASGCLPAGYTLPVGDSLIFQADFKFTQNFTPFSQNQPPLINFRSTVCGLDKVYAWKLENCTEKPMSQYSGYLEQVVPNAQRIEPCATSTELSPFYYAIRIARENLFPYEIRPLSTVLGYSYSLPTAVELVDSRLQFLRLQENTPLFGNTALTPTYSGDSIRLDLSTFFANPLDEGYEFQISTRFDTTCGYSGTQFGRTNLLMRYANMCFHNPVLANYFIANPNGYQNGSPDLQIFPEDDVLYLPTNNVELDFFLRNNSPLNAPNAWVSIVADGNLEDIEILALPSGTPLPQIAGVWQLGDLPAFGQPYLRLRAKNRACRPVDITIRFGWDCGQVTSTLASTCGSFSRQIELRPQPPEMELVVLAQPESVPLCAPSGYFTFEIYNANEGSAYDVLASVKLPVGLSIQPGSAQVSYPAGSAYINLPNPTVLPGNIYQWMPGEVSATLAANGLTSVDSDPQNALRIRFRVLAACGFVANAQPIYGAEAIQSCGISSNVLRKPGDPVGLDGVEPSYAATVNLAFSSTPSTVGCGQTAALTATISLTQIPMPGDSIYILLPTGTSFVSGSYQPIANAPIGPPQQFGQTLQLPLPASLLPGATLSFNFSVRYDDPAGCADKSVILQAREQAQAFCQSSNSFCDVYIATGEAILNLNAQNPDLQLSNFELQTQNSQTTFTANLQNAGTVPATNPLVQLYQDLNGNGQIDPNDPLLTTASLTTVLAPNATKVISGVLNLPASALCQLIARIPAAENCACADRIFPFGGNQIVTRSIGLCGLQTTNVGTENVPGNTYSWMPTPGLSCTDCAQATYTPGPDVQPNDVITLIQLEGTGNCVIERRYEIQFGGSIGIETPNQTVCKGQTVTLEATPGGTYQWSGPGVTQGVATQVLQPQFTAVYRVTVTFSGGCTGTGSAVVTVLQNSNIDLGTLTTCEGNPVSIFGTLTDEPGTYTQTLVKFNGCDSILTLRLVVTPTQTNETRALCLGDSTMVFDSLFTQSGVLCREFQSSTNCDSTHCITVQTIDAPALPPQDSSFIISENEEVTLDVPDDFNTYNWTPSAGLSCSNCADPVASPDTSTTFLLVVTDVNGCEGSAEYRVVVYPPCEGGRLKIPNAFTPNGDNNNDKFVVVPYEGFEVVRSLTIYSRWGEKIYVGGGAAAAWDGMIRGKPAPADVYVWLLEVACDSASAVRKGEVTLLR